MKLVWFFNCSIVDSCVQIRVSGFSLCFVDRGRMFVVSIHVYKSFFTGASCSSRFMRRSLLRFFEEAQASYLKTLAF